MTAKETISINKSLSLKLFKNSIGLNCYHRVIYFSNQTIENLKLNSNLIEVLSEMLRAAYDQGVDDSEEEIANKYKEFLMSFGGTK